MNIGEPWPDVTAAWARVLAMQTKLHRWAADDPGRRFDDLHNLVYDPAFLVAAWSRVRGNKGARTAGVDRLAPRDVIDASVAELLAEIREDLKSGSFVPQRVREKAIPKASGKIRRLGIPTTRDRVVQAALKLVLEPIFEAEFKPCSYGFRPRRRAQDAIAEIHFLGSPSRNYEWVFEADIAACFDEIDHTALMGRVRRRVGDKRVLGWVTAFLRAGILTETGLNRETITGTPQGGILSPLLANIALSVLDEHFADKWAALGPDWTRIKRRRAGHPVMKLVRYADDFVVMVGGTRADADALWDEVGAVLAPMGLRLSVEKTRVCHIDEGFDFLGWRIQRRAWRSRSGKKAVYTYPSKKTLASIIDKVRTLTRRARHRTLADLLRRLNPVLRGWCNYFRHGVSARTFGYLDHYAFWRIVGWLRKRHVRLNMHTLIRRFLPGWKIRAEHVEMFRPKQVAIVRYRPPCDLRLDQLVQPRRTALDARLPAADRVGTALQPAPPHQRRSSRLTRAPPTGEGSRRPINAKVEIPNIRITWYDPRTLTMLFPAGVGAHSERERVMALSRHGFGEPQQHKIEEFTEIHGRTGIKKGLAMRKSLLVGVLALSVVLTACAGSGSGGGNGSSSPAGAETTAAGVSGAPGTGSGAETHSVKIGMVGQGTSQWMVAIADDQGIFTKNNLKATYVTFNSAASEIQALIAGSIDFATDGGIPAYVQAIDGGAPITMIAQAMAVSPHVIVASKSIKSWSDLPGKTISVGGPTDITKYYFAASAEASGLTSAQLNSLHYIYAGTTAARYAALKAGTAAATVLFPPQSHVAVTEGYTNLGSVANLLPRAPFTAIGVNKKYSADNGPVVTAYVRAINEAAKWFGDSVNENKAVMILEKWAKASPADAKATYEDLNKLDEWGTDRTFSATSMTQLLKGMEKFGILKNADSPEKYYDNTFAAASGS